MNQLSAGRYRSTIARAPRSTILNSTRLLVVGSEDDPAAEAVAEVDHGCTAAETDHVGERRSQGDDQDLPRGKTTVQSFHKKQHCSSLPSSRTLHFILALELQRGLHCISWSSPYSAARRSIPAWCRCPGGCCRCHNSSKPNKAGFCYRDILA